MLRFLPKHKHLRGPTAQIADPTMIEIAKDKLLLLDLIKKHQWFQVDKFLLSICFSDNLETQTRSDNLGFAFQNFSTKSSIALLNKFVCRIFLLLIVT